MKYWSLKVKVGAYAAMLIVLGLGMTAVITLSWFHVHLLREVDEALQSEAQELFRDLRNFKGAPVNPRRPFSQKYIPLALREHYVVVRGPEGVVMYRSPALGSSNLPGEKKGLRTAEVLGNDCRVGVFQDGPYTVHVAASLDPMKHLERKLLRGFLVALPVGGLIVFAGGMWLGRKAVAPVADLTRAAERISTQRPEDRLPMPVARDEIARLTEVLNESFDRMQAAYDSARRFSADASHQLKTPLALLRIGLDELLRDSSTESGKEEVEALLQQVRRLTGLIEDLLLLAQVDAGRLRLESESVDLAALLHGAADDLEALTEAQNVEVTREVGSGLKARGDRRRISLVLQNLVENAAKYTEPGGRISINATRRNGMVQVQVANSGAVIPSGEHEGVFERFHRGSKIGENVRGHGLGLNIARELARAQGGELRLLRSEGDRTEFELELPADAGQEGI